MLLARYTEAILVLTCTIQFVSGCGLSEKDQRNQHNNSGITYEGGIDPTNHSENIATLVASADDLPACIESNNGRLYYIKATREFQLCQDSEYVLLDIKGDQGTEGEAAPSGAWVLDADGTPVGAVLDIHSVISIVTENGGAFNVFLPAGTHSSAPFLDSLGYNLEGAQCHFTSTDCTGTCYQRSGVYDASFDPTQYQSPALNAVYELSTGVFVQATGKETAVDVVLKSAWRHLANGSMATYVAQTCQTIADIENGNTYNGQAITEYSGPAFPITKSFQLPTGLSYPFKTPMTIGVFR